MMALPEINGMLTSVHPEGNPTLALHAKSTVSCSISKLINGGNYWDKAHHSRRIIPAAADPAEG